MTAAADKRRILRASAAALLVAALVLVTAVLPAEYGWDPLGTGEALGLMGMSEAGETALRAQPGRWRSDAITFALEPFEAVEYKYRLQAGDAMLYRWSSDTQVLFDMHAEPDGAAPGYAETFAKARSDSGGGSYTAPFDGIHGWFWQNRTQQRATVTLETRGYYASATEFRDGREFEYELTGDAKDQP
ncbi:MAG: hypothetical protein R3228_06720 [Halioglobus sp.]|nr:hypothetical protein [Halioglobus sp.]